MAEWYIRFYEHTNGYDQLVSEYTIFPQGLEIRNSEPGGFTAELALGQLQRGSQVQGFRRDEIAPWRTDWEIWRSPTGFPAQGKLIEGGILTSLNLAKDRDTALISGKSWLHYLERRVFPFNPGDYVDVDTKHWALWPRTWPDTGGMYGPSHFQVVDAITRESLVDLGIDMSIIVRELFESMIYDPPTSSSYTIGPPTDDTPTTPQWPSASSKTFGVPPFTYSIPTFGENAVYGPINPGDQTSIYDHMKKLSEMSDWGFDFDINPTNLRFNVYHPRKFQQGVSLFTLTPTVNQGDIYGEIETFDWTNEGPDATYLVGLGQTTYAKRTGAVWTDIDSVARFWRTDKVIDFGEVWSQDAVLQLLKDQDDIWPQKKLQVVIWNPQFHVLNFYAADRPRGLIGQQIRVIADFGLHKVDAWFRIQAIRWDIDQSTNERLTLELEMIYEPSTGPIYG